MKRWIIGLLIATGLIGGMVFWLSQQKINISFMTGKTAVAERKTLTIPIKATGLIEPAVPPIEIKSKASGEVKNLAVKAGDIIRKGQLLLELDPKDEQRNLEKTEAQMKQYEFMYEKSKVVRDQLEKDHPADVEVAKAVLDKTRSIFRQVETEYKRKKAIEESGSGAVSEQEMNLIVESYEQAKADVAQMEAQLAKVENASLQIEAARNQVALDLATYEAAKKTYEDAVERRKECSIYSPIDGMVAKINVRVGEMIQSGTSSFTGGTMLMTLADISELYVTAQVDEADISSVLELAPPMARPGVQRVEAALRENLTASAARSDVGTQELVEAVASGPAGATSVVLPGGVGQGKLVKITVEAFREEEFQGVIEHISPEPLRQQSVVTYDVRIRLVSPNRHKLLLGMQADAEFTSESVDAVVVPIDAVKVLDGDTSRGGERGVWLPVNDGSAVPGKKWQTCRFGLDDGVNIEVLSGLKEGDKVYTQLPVDINANR